MYDAALVRMFEDQCRAQLERRQPAGLEGKVRHLLLGPLGMVSTLEDVAQALAMSPRNLRRKLDEAGTSFRAIADQERRALAHSLLRSTDMTLDEIALQLGYADTASFSRACRRWFARSAGEYRLHRSI
jgi:AraC-like DNA-binding protein